MKEHQTEKTRRPPSAAEKFQARLREEARERGKAAGTWAQLVRVRKNMKGE